MDFHGIGFSTVRFSTNANNYTHEYKSGINTFPEETYIHEFLHTLERNSIEFGYEVPELHDYEKYGYKEEGTVGLKQWYADYMNCKILDEKTNTYIGLNPNIYTLKPTHENNFIYPLEIDFCKEPENIIEEIREIFKVIKQTLKIDEKENESIGV